MNNTPPLTTFVQLKGLTSEKGLLLNGRVGFVSDFGPTADNGLSERLSITLFPTVEANNGTPETISVQKKNFVVCGESPDSEYDFSLKHFQEWKTRLLGINIDYHPASSPLNAVSLQEAASAVSNDDFFALYCHFRFSESGYANGTHVVHSPLGIINARSPTGVATLHVEPATKSISAACHAQWEDITTRLRLLLPASKSKANNGTGAADTKTQREHWQSGNVIEPTYFQHLYHDVTPLSLSQHGLILEGVTDDDYLFWKQNDYKLTLRIPDIKQVLHLTVPNLSPSDINGGCCHTLSETLFLRGCTSLDITTLCSGFVLTTLGTWVHHSWMIDSRNRILETRVDKDKSSPSGYTLGSGIIAYACVAECRSRSALFQWRLQKLIPKELKLKMLTKKVMSGMLSDDQTWANTLHYNNILRINKKIQCVTFVSPEEWQAVYAKGKENVKKDKCPDERKANSQGLACVTCGNTAQTPLRRLKICPCKQAYYCNVECQKKDLERHKKEHKHFYKQIKKKDKAEKSGKRQEAPEEVDMEFDLHAGTLNNVTPLAVGRVNTPDEQRQLSVQFAFESAQAAQKHDVNLMLELAQKSIEADPTYFAGYTMRARIKCQQGHMQEAMLDFDQAHDYALRENMLQEADTSPWNLNMFRLQCQRTLRAPGPHAQQYCPQSNMEHANESKVAENFEDVWMRNIMRDPIKKQHWESLNEREREQTKEKMKNLMGMMGLTK